MVQKSRISKVVWNDLNVSESLETQKFEYLIGNTFEEKAIHWFKENRAKQVNTYIW